MNCYSRVTGRACPIEFVYGFHDQFRHRIGGKGLRLGREYRVTQVTKA
jgi:hypothetical protein